VIKGLQILNFQRAGVSIQSSASTNLIGGSNTTPGGACSGDCNLISGNGESGVNVLGSHNTVSGNYIGTDANGAEPSGNDNGVSVSGSYNVIGGDAPGERNLISGNNTGIGLLYIGTMSNTIRGNYIGTNADGTAPLPNEGRGIGLSNGTSHNLIGAGNVIAFNGGDGVWINGNETANNAISQNSIHSNGGLGINLENGGNTELPAPDITAYDLAAGTAGGTACAHCTVEVFSDASDEGRRFEGSTTADADGHWSLQMSPGSAFVGPVLTATATDAQGNTSEFAIAVWGHQIYLPLTIKQ
jgi:hypothetical protein